MSVEPRLVASPTPVKDYSNRAKTAPIRPHNRDLVQRIVPISSSPRRVYSKKVFTKSINIVT